MARLCERPGCSQPAEVTYGIDADHLLVWIESLDSAITYRAGVLCRRHADAMVVPLGWMLDDRREPIPRLFKPRDPVTPAPARPRRRVTVQRDDTGQLELPSTDSQSDDSQSDDSLSDDSESADVDGAEEVAAAETDETSAPWKPVFDQNDDLDGLLVANSPLLSRAFGQRDMPNSS